MLDAGVRKRLVDRYAILAALSEAELDRLLACAIHMKAPAGALMFDENEICRGFPLILSGVARIIKAAPSGRALHLYDLVARVTRTEGTASRA